MDSIRTEEQIVAELDSVALEIADTSCYLEGSLQKSVKRYRKKDGTVSEYLLPPVLQYPKAGGGQGRMRIPRRHTELVGELLGAGDQRRKLLDHHRALSLEWVKLRMRSKTAEKKTTLHNLPSSR